MQSPYRMITAVANQKVGAQDDHCCESGEYARSRIQAARRPTCEGAPRRFGSTRELRHIIRCRETSDQAHHIRLAGARGWRTTSVDGGVLPRTEGTH